MYSSRIIVALDPAPTIKDPLEWALRIIDDTRDLVAGYEIGLPLIIRLGSLDALKELADRMGDYKIKILDFKLADIGDIMADVMEPLIKIGINTFTVHGFIGYKGALDKLCSFGRVRGVNIVIVVSMRHPGSADFIDPVSEDLLHLAVRAGVWGVSVPATRPWIVNKVRKILEWMGMRYIKILSPGIGFEDALPGDALRAGADYEVIGRTITRDKSPRSKVIEINNIHKEILKSIEEWV